MDDERGWECARCRRRLTTDTVVKCTDCGRETCVDCFWQEGNTYCDLVCGYRFDDEPPLVEEQRHVVHSPYAKVRAFVARLLPRR